MGTVAQLKMSSRLLRSPRHASSVCEKCFNLTRGFSRCFACSQLEDHLAVMVPVSYSVGHEYLHHILADYKRLDDERARSAGEQLSAILSMFLAHHEPCVVHAARVQRFNLVTTVPSGNRHRDAGHPLRRIVGELVAETRDRHERLLMRSSRPAEPRAFDARRFQAVRRLHGESVLLIDDTWTTGASAQSAAAALRAAGAGTVAAVVLGRHLNRGWHENDQHLDTLSFDWRQCALCARSCVAGARAAASGTSGASGAGSLAAGSQTAHFLALGSPAAGSPAGPPLENHLGQAA